MDISKLQPILNKESILKTANAAELAQAQHEIMQRYSTYALTHVPLGDTSKQLENLRRVIVENKTCAVGTIVGPYGYGKTSTAVHLWNEIRNQQILAVPPFLWKNLSELMDSVYHWLRYEFSQGPKTFLPNLERAYESQRADYLEKEIQRSGADPQVIREWISEGRLILDLRASDVISFFHAASQICEQAGYKGLVVFTDELQATVAAYPSRDKFFADLFEMVVAILGTPGHWALILTMDDDTEGQITRLRADLLQRLQRSALHFRVKEVYNRREYPKELWQAFEQRFGFDGSEVILDETLESIGQVAARSDLGAGPRMVTNAMAQAIKHYDKTSQTYTPMHFVDDFLAGLMVFDQRGKFGTAVKKALDNQEIRGDEAVQQVVKLIAAYPMGCPEKTLTRFGMLQAFQSFPPLARRELILQVSGGYILRYLAEEELPPEQIEQRLTKEFVTRYAPGKQYAVQAALGFLRQVLLEPIFNGWKAADVREMSFNDTNYNTVTLRGSFDQQRYPDRQIHLMVAAVPQSPAPKFEKAAPDCELEMRFELNYAIAPGEPSRLIVTDEHPGVAIFQLNIGVTESDTVNKVLPKFLFDFYNADQLNPLLCLSLINYLYSNRGNLPDDQQRVSTVIAPLRQFALSVLLGESLEVTNPEYSGGMVGADRIKELFRIQCRKLYPKYRTLMSDRNWHPYLQQYCYALEKVINDDGISIARGRHPWTAAKEEVADAFHIPGRRLTTLEVMVKSYEEIGLLDTVQFSGRSSASEVTLQFKLHPLEEEWLRIIDSSRQQVNHKGSLVQAVPAEEIIRFSKKLGYTDAEIQEVIRLLIARKYVDLDQRQNMIVRTVDAIDDLREAVQGLLDQIAKEILALKEALPEFDEQRYPLTKLRSDLATAKERDEIERIRAELRRYSGGINAFVGGRTASLKEAFQREQESLHNLIRQGLPLWLEYSFQPCPLYDVLEKQRTQLVAAYQATLDEIRRTRDAYVRRAQDITGSNVEVIIQTYELLREFTDKSRRLTTRLQSYTDQREDLESWRQAAKSSSDLDAKVSNISEVYEYSEFSELAARLWKALKEEFETDPLVLTKHAKAREQITNLDQRVGAWIENRRDDFDKKCAGYQQSLREAGIHIDLRVPFDPEHPSDSVNVLLEQVKNALEQFIENAVDRLNHALLISRFAIKVQRLPFETAEKKTEEALAIAKKLSSRITVENIRDPEIFQGQLIQPIVNLLAQEQQLYAEIQKAVQQRPPEGTEVRLMQLLAENVAGSYTDLRGLILRLIEAGEQDVDLDRLMKDLKSLFQKNQISIQITLTKS